MQRKRGRIIYTYINRLPQGNHPSFYFPILSSLNQSHWTRITFKNKEKLESNLLFGGNRWPLSTFSVSKKKESHKQFQPQGLVSMAFCVASFHLFRKTTPFHHLNLWIPLALHNRALLFQLLSHHLHQPPIQIQIQIHPVKELYKRFFFLFFFFC